VPQRAARDIECARGVKILIHAAFYYAIIAAVSPLMPHTLLFSPDIDYAIFAFTSQAYVFAGCRAPPSCFICACQLLFSRADVIYG